MLCYTDQTGIAEREQQSHAEVKDTCTNHYVPNTPLVQDLNIGMRTAMLGIVTTL